MHRPRFRLGILLLTAALLPAQDVNFVQLPKEDILARFGRIKTANPDRVAELRQMFTEAGCQDHLSEAKVRGSKLPNVVCTLPGTAEVTIVVTAHFDNAGPGEGAIDNWSGASLLPSLYESMLPVQHAATFLFIGFTDEEKGLYGSTEWVSRLTKEERNRIIADINVDSVGLAGPLRIWHTRANKKLENSAIVIAKALQVPLQGTNVDGVGDTDSHPFYMRGIPVIDFHSISTATFPTLHSKKDVRAALEPGAYYDTYRFLAAFLTVLGRNTSKF
jgi:putative aminopeptidase FrvX